MSSLRPLLIALFATQICALAAPANAEQNAAPPERAQESAAPMANSPPAMQPWPTESISAQHGAPQWLDEVRAQRRALLEQRRAARQARQEARDPIGSAQREERQAWLRRRQEERRSRIETLHRPYLNHGPWLMPLAPSRPGADLEQDRDGESVSMPQPTDQGSDHQDPTPGSGGWNNLWYFNGW
jgi:hypothetical protein